MKAKIMTLSCIVIGICFGINIVQGLTPVQLKLRLAQDEKITLIDVRDNALYQKHHIVGAINIPCDLIGQKSLPSLGNVVIYGSGLGKESVAEAAALLNQKPGLHAEVLEGGYAAWLEAQGATTQAKGTHPQTWDIISYANLKTAEDAVIVDLRKPRRLPRQGVDSATTEAPLTDLSKEFPRARISRSPLEMPKLRQNASQTGEVRPLIVLVDDGDGSGTAENQAKILRANGIRRVAILAGGESIIVRQGKSGLQRQGVSLGNESQK